MLINFFDLLAIMKIHHVEHNCSIYCYVFEFEIMM